MEPITYTLNLVASGEIRNDDHAGYETGMVRLFSDGYLWEVVIEEREVSWDSPRISRAIDEVRFQAVFKACVRSQAHNYKQIYEALGIPVNPDGSVPDA